MLILSLLLTAMLVLKPSKFLLVIIIYLTNNL